LKHDRIIVVYSVLADYVLCCEPLFDFHARALLVSTRTTN